MTDVATRPPGRYGSPRPGGRWVAVVAALIAAAFLGWLTWSTVAFASPQVTSQLNGWEADGPHQVSARIDVALSTDARRDGVTATCTVRAYAEDHLIVGERVLGIDATGLSTVTVRTERTATAVELVGCTTPDQTRPR